MENGTKFSPAGVIIDTKRAYLLTQYVSYTYIIALITPTYEEIDFKMRNKC